MSNEDVERIRAAVAMRFRATPIPSVDADAVLWPLPGRVGFVPITGSPGASADDWTLVDSDITLAQMKAVQDRLSVAGLGALATILWHNDDFLGHAVAWGPTPAEALVHLVEGVDELWPRTAAAVVDPILEGAWAPGEARITAAGPAVTAPAASPLDYKALTASRDFAALWTAPVDRRDWLTGLRTAVGYDPRTWARALMVAYTTRLGGSDKYTSIGHRAGTRNVGLVQPTVPVRYDVR